MPSRLGRQGPLNAPQVRPVLASAPGICSSHSAPLSLNQRSTQSESDDPLSLNQRSTQCTQSDSDDPLSLNQRSTSSSGRARAGDRPSSGRARAELGPSSARAGPGARFGLPRGLTIPTGPDITVAIGGGFMVQVAVACRAAMAPPANPASATTGCNAPELLETAQSAWKLPESGCYQ
jgi:hypothetical protein